MATFYQTESKESFSYEQFAGNVESASQVALSKFRQFLNSHVLFHLSMIALVLVQVVILGFLIATHPRSAILALSLSTLFLSIFSYIVLIYYFEGKKPEQIEEIRQTFLTTCKRLLPINLPASEYHLSLANAVFLLTTHLHHRQSQALSIPPFQFCENFVLKLSYFFNRKALLLMQEKLMEVAVLEHMHLIQKEPTDLTAHTSLANTYITLSKLYQGPSEDLLKNVSWVKRFYKQERITNQFHLSVHRAIEELRVLDDLAPNDPWVHAQLASCYHHLDKQKEEIKEYEILVSLRPRDKEILFRLGLLYFEMGKNAKGLTTYETLKQIDASKALELISYYNARFQSVFSFFQ